MKKVLAMLMAAFLLMGSSAFAGTSPAQQRNRPTTKKRFSKRQDNQQRRIHQGTQSGALTDQEAARLQRQSDKLDSRAEKMAESGDKLTVGERRALEHQQDNLSRRIHKQKHDRQTQPPATPPSH